MAEALQIICAALIIAAVVFFFFFFRKAQFGATTGQMILSVIQIILCGWFFALCISDILDIPVSFSPERLILMIVYALAFLALTIFTLFTQHKESSIHLRLVFFAVILLIVLVQIIGIREHRGMGTYKRMIRPFVFILPLMLMDELAKPISLTFRLYGNTYGDEMVVEVLREICPFLLPVVMQLLVVLLALIQAIVFALLTAIYIGEAVEKETNLPIRQD